MNLVLENAACGYGTRTVARNISLSVSSGEALFLLGPNGSGKTTLFKTLLGLLPLQGGRITIDGADTTRWSQRRLAQKLAYVPQAHTPPFAFSVRDVVLTARTAHVGLFRAPGRVDTRIAEAALTTMGIARLADARYTEISGGERQLVLIARAIAQGAPFLVMDEPASNLDFGNQVHLMARIRSLTKQGYGLIVTTHAPDQAFCCAHKVAMLHKGQLAAYGPPADVLTAPLLEATYGVAVRIVREGETRTCLPTLQ